MAEQRSAWEALKNEFVYHPPPAGDRQTFSGNAFCTQCSKIDFSILFNGPRANWVLSRNEHGTHDKIWRVPPQYVHYLLNDVSTMLKNPECPMCNVISVIWREEFPQEQPTNEQCFLMPVMSHHAYLGDMGCTIYVSESNRDLEGVATHVLIQFQPGHSTDLNLNGMTIGEYRPSDSHLSAWRLETHPGMLNILRSSLSRPNQVQDSIDWSTLRMWLQNCRRNHPECAHAESHACHPEMGYCVHDHNFNVPDTMSTPIRCIDIKTFTVRAREAHEEYVTLSWVWGNSQIDRRRIFHHDQVHLIVNQLPATIQDAITATEQLGQNLLWVDAVCINQDDEDDLSRQINQMNIIYSESAFTICAAAGRSGEAGLPGVRPNSRQQRQQQTVQARRHTIFATPSGRLRFEDLIDPSPWRKRGWTFQEEFLSRKLLIFTEQEVLFRCKGGTGRETIVPPNKIVLGRMPCYASIFETDYIDSGSPRGGWSFSFYRGLVHRYSSRQLTYQKDTLNAFRGLENMLFNIQGVKFCSGLPETDLLNALMWVHTGHLGSVKRKGIFPSWSWAEWEGTVDYFHWERRISRHSDEQHRVQVQTKGEERQDVLYLGHSVVIHDDSGSKLLISGQTSKIRIRRCLEQASSIHPHTITGRTGVACEVFDPRSNTYIDCFQTKSTRQRDSTSQILQASNNPGLEDYVPEYDGNQRVPFVLYLDPDTNHEPFEVECILVAGWIDEKYMDVASGLTDGWHHVVVLVFERIPEDKIQRIGLLYLDVAIWLLATPVYDMLILV